jgi:hypothetical protein
MGVRTRVRYTQARLAELPPEQELAVHVLNECVCMLGRRCHDRSVELARKVRDQWQPS